MKQHKQSKKLTQYQKGQIVVKFPNKQQSRGKPTAIRLLSHLLLTSLLNVSTFGVMTTFLFCDPSIDKESVIRISRNFNCICVKRMIFIGPRKTSSIEGYSGNFTGTNMFRVWRESNAYTMRLFPGCINGLCVKCKLANTWHDPSRSMRWLFLPVFILLL